MSAEVLNRRRLALPSLDGRHATRLADATSIELLRWFLSGDSNGAIDGLIPLARRDPSLAAWLVDWTTRGAVECLLADGASDARHARPLLSREIGDLVLQLKPDDVLRKLSHWVESAEMFDPPGQDWVSAQRRAAMTTDRVTERARSQRLSGIDDIYWWSSLMSAPWYVRDSERGGWKRRTPVRPPVNIESDHPLTDSLKCLEFAEVQVEISLEAEPKSAPLDVRLRRSENDSWPDVFSTLLRRLVRCGELEGDAHGVIEREKLLSMKELAYGASHEINNPLANIASRAQLLLRNESDAEKRRSLATINSQALRAHEMIADMMLFAKPPTIQSEDLCVTRFVGAMIDDLTVDLPEGVRLRRHVPIEEWMVQGDPVQLSVAFRSIWANAIEAMAGNGELTVTVRIRPSESSESHSAWVEVEFEDTGPGIRPEVRQHLFDPFFSGREAGRGLGFGLSKAWRIVQLHEGRITVVSEPGEGASLTVSLPMTERTDASGP